MDDFFEELERNNTIEVTKKFYEETQNEEMALQFLKCGLNVSVKKAQEIFEAEVLGEIKWHSKSSVTI